MKMGSFSLHRTKRSLQRVPGISWLLNKILPNTSAQVTAIGSCFCGFIVNHLKAKIPVILNNHLQARSDGAFDLILDLRPDIELIQYYFSRGYWQLGGRSEGHQKDLFKTIIAWYRHGMDFFKDRPDILLFDSLFEQNHNFYKHRKGKWKAAFGKLYFDDPGVAEAFEEDFEFIGRIQPEETAENVAKICAYFKARNPRVKIFYMHFPLLPDYIDPKIIERDIEIKEAISGLEIENFHVLVIPIEEVKPLTDPDHPNYSFQVWNHFYPEVYDYFAGKIVSILSKYEHR